MVHIFELIMPYRQNILYWKMRSARSPTDAPALNAGKRIVDSGALHCPANIFPGESREPELGHVFVGLKDRKFLGDDNRGLLPHHSRRAVADHIGGGLVTVTLVTWWIVLAAGSIQGHQRPQAAFAERIHRLRSRPHLCLSVRLAAIQNDLKVGLDGGFTI